jgi:hypothetical protein
MKQDNWSTLERSAARAGVPAGEKARLFSAAKNGDPIALETCLDLLLEALSETGLDEDSEPNAQGLIIEDAIFMFARMLQRANDGLK